MKKTVVFLIAVLIALYGCKDKIKSGETDVKRQTITGLKVVELKETRVDDFYETTGTVKAKHTTMVSSRLMGTVKTVTVREGESVQKGQVLVTIDDADLAEKVRSAEKAVEVARQQRSLMEVTYKRYKGLYDEKALSKQELDQIETQKKVAELEYERAQSALAEAKTYQGYATIKAPITGVVTSKKVEIGSMAVPGVPMLVIETTEAFDVEVPVDEGLLGKVKLGDPVEVYIDSLARHFKAKVSEIVRAIDPQTRTFTIKIALSEKGLRSGQFVRVRIPMGHREVVTVPHRAIVQKGQLQGVYTVDSNGLITYRLVKLGKSYGDHVEVISGLKAGDRIIPDETEKVIDGATLIGVKG